MLCPSKKNEGNPVVLNVLWAPVTVGGIFGLITFNMCHIKFNTGLILARKY